MVKKDINYIGILKYLEKDSGKEYTDPNKVEDINKKRYFEDLRAKSKVATKELREIAELCTEKYNVIPNGQINWLLGSNKKLRSYLWVQMKYNDFKDSLISVSIFVEFEPNTTKARFRVSLEIKNDGTDKKQMGKYHRHLEKTITDPLVYIVGSNELKDIELVNESTDRIKSKLKQGLYNKVQVSIIINQRDGMTNKDYENEILDSVGKILPYYDYVLGIGDEDKNIVSSSCIYNRIVFGAPGTGKSYKIKEDVKAIQNLGGDFERVTFHPDYSYANFVGTYKPTMNGNDISYKYVPGPFMRMYKEALNNPKEPHVLVIEEINRANVAAVFGDIFQLLDRDENGLSEYPIEASEDIKQYLKNELKEDKDYTKIALPNNMFIWATMNSADQGVFPMDTAFKRRWNFEYLGIDDGQDDMEYCKVTLGRDEYKTIIEWNELRKAINTLLTSYNLNEDKLMGPFFLSQKLLRETTPERSDKFIEIFKSKVIMYLFEDAARQKRSKLFDGENRYSEICKKFDSKGIYIFDDEIASILGVQK